MERQREGCDTKLDNVWDHCEAKILLIQALDVMSKYAACKLRDVN